MRLLALLLLIGTAHAQGLTTSPPGVAGGGKVLWQAPFSAPGCYASGSTAGASSAISITRATSATYWDGSAIQTCTANQFRVAPTDGLLVEPARTQYVLNATTHPKAAQATGSLSTGAHVAWHIGPGTMTLAAGTATVTGLSCTAVAAGTLCPFTVTVAGTMAITTEAGVTHAQVENGAYRTSFIASAGTSVARNADQVIATVPAVTGGKWCLATTASLLAGTAWTVEGANGSRIWSLGTHAATDTQLLTPAIFDGYDAAGTRKYWQFTASAAAATTPIRYVACSTGPTVGRDGTPATLTPGGTGVPTFSPTATTLYIGGRSGGLNPWPGYLKAIKLCGNAKKIGDCK